MNKLARLDGAGGLKDLLNISGTSEDTVLRNALQAASAIAEREAGLLPGNLRRQTAIVEYPRSSPSQSRYAYLRVRPVEAITAVKQLHTTSPAADFTAEQAMTEFEEWALTSAELGAIERINGVWTLLPFSLQVTYDGGYWDPEDADPPATAILPPDDLEHAILQQAVMIWHSRDNAGLREINAGDAGSFTTVEMKVHPALKAAVMRFRRGVV